MADNATIQPIQQYPYEVRLADGSPQGYYATLLEAASAAYQAAWTTQYTEVYDRQHGDRPVRFEKCCDVVMGHRSYNGWTNRATWCANLWLTNDEIIENTVAQICRAGNNVEGAAESLSAYVQGQLDAAVAEAQETVGKFAYAWLLMMSDILDLRQVNWKEIVQVYRGADG
jgi:hypothetical protein